VFSKNLAAVLSKNGKYLKFLGLLGFIGYPAWGQCCKTFYVLNLRIFIIISCKIFEQFALKVDPVIEFIQLGSTPFKDSAILAPKLADPPFWWKSNSTPSKSGSGLPDPD